MTRALSISVGGWCRTALVRYCVMSKAPVSHVVRAMALCRLARFGLHPGSVTATSSFVDAPRRTSVTDTPASQLWIVRSRGVRSRMKGPSHLSWKEGLDVAKALRQGGAGKLVAVVTTLFVSEAINGASGGHADARDRASHSERR